MKPVLSLALALAFAGAASACPMQHQSAEADMTRVASLAPPISTPVDPVATSSTEADAGTDAEAPKTNPVEE